MKEVKSKTKKEKVVYFTQKELANRWRVTQATIKEMRDKGAIPCFFPPGSTRVLYPVEEILLIEQAKTNYNKIGGKRKRKLPETNMKQPVISANSYKEWRI